jgi:molybdenum cofactor cytidylyltransferase
VTRPFITGLVLAAGASRRLGQPKQLLPFGAGTLLDHALGVARRCHYDQSLCVIGGGGPDVRERVDLSGFEVIENTAFGEGCSSSIATALGAVDPRADALVLMLGDQPGVTPSAVAALIAGRGEADLAACAYDDGRGHPFLFARAAFADLADLHGDKGVWKLMDRAAGRVADVPVPGPVPPDVDTWADYESVLGAAGLPVPLRT